MRVPSSNTASTFTSRDDVGHARQHVVDRQDRRAGRGRRHQPRPSRAASQTVSAISAVASGTFKSQAAGSPRSRQFGRREDQQPIAIRRCQAHGLTLFGVTLLA